MNMTTEIANTETQTKPPTLQQTLEKMTPQFKAALPKHLTAERLIRVVMTAARNTPKLLECDRQSFFSAVMTCAQLGLEPDGVLGQAYLIPFAGKVQFIPGYKGLISLARNSGEVEAIKAEAVYEKDDFDFAFGINERLEHIPSRELDRGEIIYFYAYAKFKDGGHHFEVMPLAEVEAIRDNSQGYKAAVATAKKYGKPLKSPWSDHFSEMGKKTAIRRMSKFLPLSVQKAAALAESYNTGTPLNLNEYGEFETIEPANDLIEKLDPSVSKLDALEAEIIDQETGEVSANEDTRKLDFFKDLYSAENTDKFDVVLKKHNDYLTELEKSEPDEFKNVQERINEKEVELTG